MLAGALTFAPSGNGKTVPGLPPTAIEKPISEGVLERVKGDAEGGRVRERLGAKLDQVGGVVGVAGPGRIRVRAVGLGEQVALARRPRIGRIGQLARAVVVVQVVLVEELARPVCGRARDEDRRCLPRSCVRELGRRGGRLVQDGRPGLRSRSGVQRGVCCAGRRHRNPAGERHRDGDDRFPHTGHPTNA